ncbi:glycosyl transferase family 1 [Taibaiella sp. KBW10]|uniref:glycosyltransferase n=1 Tax=Taibaiella sp. KBW10 TaxID=2153357 RepID=UPI000F597C06|nr:glycosyltransferase [Taibaiella sp. KBW10]RQO32074.1 glycosyl transferase family 1 [Taibaiella sp. KBW10]
MKIIIIGSAYPLRGGIATFNERFASFMQAQGHDVIIYSYSLQYPSFLFPGKTQYSTEPAPENIHIKPAINSANPLNWIKAGRQLRNENADLILVRYWMPYFGPSLGTILRTAAKNRKTKIICIADNIIPHEKRTGDTAFTKYFVKPIHAFLTMSQSVLKDLEQFAPQKPKLYTPHPLYDNFGDSYPKAEARKKLNIPADEKVILFFGFIRKYKGLDLLLEAMTDARIKQKGIKLMVAGEFYEKRESYDNLIQSRGLADQLYLFTDFIPNAEVGLYFSAADVVVQPYRNATQSGITQICFHFNKPMVVTNVGGLAESIPDGKIGYVAEVDPTSIADNILRFYEEGKEETLIEHIKAEKKKYSWDYFLDSIMQLYKTINHQ